ncbi:hypothetical protein ABEB36_012421 [Hypothenemus hampei]|uniref:UDP-glucuronosyltransferase n=1 Tax=Hypothenemus hampei TaxID=57062 RepID=A0ABD1EDV2_HYPHA
MKMKVVPILLLFVTLFGSLNGEKLLLIFHSPSKSHYFLGNELAKGLAKLGHEVTIVAPFEEKNPPKNYRNIVLENVETELGNNLRRNLFELDNIPPFYQLLFLFSSPLQGISELVLNNVKIQNLLKSNETFDAVILDQTLNDALKWFAYHFKVPLILLWSQGANRYVNNPVANPQNPSYIVDMFLNFNTPMTFYERFYNFVFGAMQDLILYYYLEPNQNKILKKYMPDAPDLGDPQYNVSLVICNSHESIYEALPHVPNMIDIGGFHVNPSEKLSKDLKKFMDNAKEGVIYFSMGSILKPSNMPKDKKDIILKVLGSRKEKVLWKWDEDQLENKPDNVMISKWFPQHSILAHPNCKLFITHGGLLSTTETVYFGVPVLAFPMFGDQNSNAERITAKGFGLKMKFAELTEESLTEALVKLLEDPTYLEKAKHASALLHDRPLKPIELADYWIKYVIRHKGAPHLRVAGVNLPLYKYYMIDVLAVILGVLLVAFLVIRSLYRRVFRIKSSECQKIPFEKKKN